MHITTLVAAALTLTGGFVVLRWMPGLPQRPAARDSEPARDGEPGYEAELAIMEENMLKTAEREG
jgi:hypothetical protein